MKLFWKVSYLIGGILVFLNIAILAMFTDIVIDSAFNEFMKFALSSMAAITLAGGSLVLVSRDKLKKIKSEEGIEDSISSYQRIFPHDNRGPIFSARLHRI